jgi:hypothetical protein
MVMQRMVFPGFALAAALATQNVMAEVSEREVGVMKIRVNIEGKTLTATLADNQTSREFVSLLPLKLKLEDFASTEKISYLPRKLPTPMHRRAPILQSATLRTTPPGAIWLSSSIELRPQPLTGNSE